jgi:hypothetical protein
LKLDAGILRGIEDAVDALARLDELVASSARGLSTLVMLRSAQAIVAANDRPPGDGTKGEDLDGDRAFAALLGWWYAPVGREFIVDDPHLHGVAQGLDAASDRIRGGHPLTSGLLDNVMREAALDLPLLADGLDLVLREAEHESWPSLLLAAELSSGAPGHVRTVSASMARVVAPLTGGLCANVYVVAGCAHDSAGALHAFAKEARDMARLVAAYRHACAQAAERCRAFGRGAASALSLVELLAQRPATTVAMAASALKLTAPTAGAAVERLVGAELLREITGRGRDRVFVYTPAVTLAG